MAVGCRDACTHPLTVARRRSFGTCGAIRGPGGVFPAEADAPGGSADSGKPVGDKDGNKQRKQQMQKQKQMRKQQKQ